MSDEVRKRLEELGKGKTGIDPNPHKIPELYLSPWTPDLSEERKKHFAEQDFDLRWRALGGAPGASKVPGEAGVVILDGNFYHEYEHGVLYYSPHYERPVYVGGNIGGKYQQLGGPRSWLGWPLANAENPLKDQKDEQPIDEEGGLFSTFERGAIYWWPDTGAIDLGTIAIRYRGLTCFATTFGPGSDEPYVIFGTLPLPPAEPLSVRTKIYEEVDGGKTRTDDIELYRGLPYGLALEVVLMEHDKGDPKKYLEEVKSAVTQAGNGLALAAAAIPGVGVGVAAVVKVVFEKWGPDIAEEVNDLLGTEDDLIEQFTWNITPKQIVTATQVDPQNFRGIDFHLESRVLSDGNASYKIYLTINGV